MCQVAERQDRATAACTGALFHQQLDAAVAPEVAEEHDAVVQLHRMVRSEKTTQLGVRVRRAWVRRHRTSRACIAMLGMKTYPASGPI